MDKEDFIDYVLSFYNSKDGIYPDVDATYAEVVDAVRKLHQQFDNVCYDSVDRERVRDIILKGRK